MLLQDKIAVIFGAGGAIGRQVAREFAGEGAAVFLSGRHLRSVEKVAQEICAANETAYAAEVNALNEQAVNTYLDRVAQQAGRLDIVFNVIGPQVVEYDNGIAAMELAYEKFLVPFNAYTASNFLTSRAAARHMLPRQSGVILYLSATPSQGVPGTIAIGAAMGALEAMMRVFAAEWSPSGIRVVGICSAGMSDTRTIQQSFETVGRGVGLSLDEVMEGAKQRALLKRMPVVNDTAKIAAFVASDRANTLTGTIINSSCGEVLD